LYAPISCDSCSDKKRVSNYGAKTQFYPDYLDQAKRSVGPGQRIEPATEDLRILEARMLAEVFLQVKHTHRPSFIA
jgi:hypothetical protein